MNGIVRVSAADSFPLSASPSPLSSVLPQHPDEHCPERPVLLAVDQQVGEGAALR
jgi:hypothetical protein